MITTKCFGEKMMIVKKTLGSQLSDCPDIIENYYLLEINNRCSVSKLR